MAEDEEDNAGSRRLVLEKRDDAAIRGSLLAAMHDVLIYARHQVESAADDRVTAVHEFRKSLRRARALARLCRPFSAPGPALRLGSALKEAHRTASPLRDLDVLVATLDSHHLEQPGGEAAARLRSSLERQHQERMTADRVIAALQRAIVGCADAVTELDRGLPKELSFRDLLYGLRRTYRTARRQYQRARRVPDELLVHSWRKRSKDVTYQLELVSPGKAAIKELRKEYSGMTSSLGEITDLALLRRTAQESEELFGVPGHEELLAAIGELLAARLGAAMDLGERLYELPPRKFADKVEALDLVMVPAALSEA